MPLLNERGAKATGADTFPTKAQLDETDVLILHKQEAGNVEEADRKNLNEYLARGGGLVVIHAGLVSRDPDWFKTIVGGAWRNGTAKWLEGPMHLYFTDRDSPISNGASNWEMDDEIYYDLEMMPEARILASAYTPKAAGARNANFQRRADELTGGGKKVGIYDIQPQMWTYERTVDGAPRAVPRVRLDPRASLRELQPPELPGDTAARHRVGRQARERRRAANPERQERARRCPPLSRRRADRAGQGRREDRGASRVRSDARRRRAADRQGDEHRLGREGPAVGLGNARVSQRPARAEHRVRARHQLAQARHGRRATRRTRSRSCPTPTATA